MHVRLKGYLKGIPFLNYVSMIILQSCHAYESCLGFETTDMKRIVKILFLLLVLISGV